MTPNSVIFLFFSFLIITVRLSSWCCLFAVLILNSRAVISGAELIYGPDFRSEFTVCIHDQLLMGKKLYLGADYMAMQQADCSGCVSVKVPTVLVCF